MYVCRRLNLGRIRKDIDNSRSNLGTLQNTHSWYVHEESSRPEPSSSSEESTLPPEVEIKLRPRSNTDSPVMAYLLR
jgi:hypothetical protein